MKCKSVIAAAVSLVIGATAALNVYAVPADEPTDQYVPVVESANRTVNLSALSTRPSVVLAVQPAIHPDDASDYEIITCIDYCGNLWQFCSDAGDWCVSDGCDLLLLDTAGTADITDDQIIGATYVRYDMLPEFDLD